MRQQIKFLRFLEILEAKEQEGIIFSSIESRGRLLAYGRGGTLVNRRTGLHPRPPRRLIADINLWYASLLFACARCTTRLAATGASKITRRFLRQLLAFREVSPGRG